MKHIITLSFLCALLQPVGAQVFGEFLVMDFEPDATLVLDSVYPSGCWQVGAPDKTLFTSALSLPNALVTDTVQPHPSSTTCYAEFTLIADEFSGDFGRWFEFNHWLDLAPGSKAYIEARDTWSPDWSRLTDGWYMSGSVLFGPEGYEFMSSTGGWEQVIFDSPCIGVMAATNARWYDPLMRIRFVLEAGDNSSGHDGWMIDDFRATATMCMGGVTEHRFGHLVLAPNPVSDRVLVDLGEANGRSVIRVIRGDGALISEDIANGNRAVLNVSELPAGLYLIKASGSATGQATLLIQR